jgi:predicted MFS family arabinose efflux permease
MFVGMVSGGYLADKWAYRISASIGLSLQAAGFLMLGYASSETITVAIVSGMLIASFGSGMTLIPLAKGALYSLGAARTGLASGLFNSVRVIGSAVASPLLGLLLARGYRGGLDVPNLIRTYQAGFQILACVAAIGIVVAFTIPEILGDDLDSNISQAIH